MKIRIFLYTLIVALIVGVSGCGGGNKEVKKDAGAFADAMCRSIENMRKLRATNPADTLLLQKLQQDQRNIEAEMMTLHQDFKKKYGDEAKTPEFNKQYRKFLSEAMLDCKALSKEDRAMFEKELK
jgi:hypothetical protein